MSSQISKNSQRTGFQQRNTHRKLHDKTLNIWDSVFQLVSQIKPSNAREWEVRMSR